MNKNIRHGLFVDYSLVLTLLAVLVKIQVQGRGGGYYRLSALKKELLSGHQSYPGMIIF